MTIIDQPTPRIPPIQDGQDPEFDAIADGVRAAGKEVPNLQRLMGHNPRIARGMEAYTSAMRFESSVPKDLIELAILRAALLEGGRYPFAQHIPMALNHGVTDEQLRSIDGWEAATCFDATERAVLRAVDEMVDGTEVSDATFALLQERFEPPAILELVLLIAFYASLSMVVNSLHVPVDGRVQGALAQYWPAGR